MKPLLGYLFLANGIVFGIASNSFAKISEGFTKLTPSVLCILFMCITMFSIAKAMSALPVGFAYSTYSGLTVTGVVLFAVLKFNQIPNIYGIIGLGKAMELAYSNLENHQKYVQKLKLKMMQEIQSMDNRISFNGETDPNKSLYTVLNVSFPKDICNSMLLFSLDIHGIAASGGSACSSGSSIGSHVLAELPNQENKQAVRFSFSRFTTNEEIEYTLEKIRTIIKNE